MSTRDTFSVTYQLVAESRSEAENIARNICVEQSVEMPVDAVPSHVLSSIAQLISLDKSSDNRWLAVIDFPKLLVGSDPTQLLNVIFGNSSLQPGIKVMDVDSSILEEQLRGPAFGIEGIRKLLGIPSRPLSCTALKPIGLSPADLAERAYKFTKGGIDIIKDDHGLVNQPSADFFSRVSSCVRAVRKGEQNSGKHTLYFPNITCSPMHIFDRLEQALELGADGVLISPQMTGLETMHELSKKAAAPIMAHPAFSGSMVINDLQGITADLYYGKIWRAFGADCIIYPNARGRFSFDIKLCKSINRACRADMNNLSPSFPTPGGGINRDSIGKWLNEYESDTIFLIGGSLYQHPEGIEFAAREFQNNLENYDK
jgi:ribulose-bisphosphate carboxylase large chain